jgi:hypothetical protein
MQRLRRGVVDHPAEDVAGEDERVVVHLLLIVVDDQVRGRRPRAKAVLVERPVRVVHARPLELRGRHARAPAHERRREDVRGLADEPALARDADRRERIVARDHSARKVRGA